MPIIRFLRKLSGLVKAGPKMDSPISKLHPNLELKKLSSDFPGGDRIAKKQNWIAAKNKK